jgi:hypothetical protein
VTEQLAIQPNERQTIENDVDVDEEQPDEIVENLPSMQVDVQRLDYADEKRLQRDNDDVAAAAEKTAVAVDLKSDAVFDDVVNQQRGMSAWLENKQKSKAERID